jgi:hypothetical protein
VIIYSLYGREVVKWDEKKGIKLKDAMKRKGGHEKNQMSSRLKTLMLPLFRRHQIKCDAQIEKYRIEAVSRKEKNL